MTDEQKAAYVVGESVAAFIEALGMISENLQRVQRGETLAYEEKSFLDVAGRHCIYHNDTLGLFHS